MPAKGGPVEDKEDEDSVGKEEVVALAAVCAGGLATLWLLKRLLFRSKKPASRPAAVSAAAAASAPGPIARDAVSRWTVRGVTDFLNGLGLGRYAPAFTDAAVDGQLLLQLTTEDMVELGVSKRVHRVRHAPRRGGGASGFITCCGSPSSTGSLTPSASLNAQKKIRLRLGLPLDEDDGASSLAVRLPRATVQQHMRSRKRCGTNRARG
jgi:SAM domain (Sterile alpha motif)